MDNRILGVLDLERLDRDLYRAQSHWSKPRPNLYGGQVAAQALRAATLTVPEGRQPHSLHGYFLRRGSTDKPIILQVFRDRDGGSFSARRVVVVQEGEVLFTVSAGFHATEASGEYQIDPPVGVPDPDGLPPAATHDWAEGDPVVDMRPVRHHSSGAATGEAFVPYSRTWVRAGVDLPDDPALHACILTYVSDYGTGFAGTEVDGLSKGGPSLDHAVWFHQPVRLDDWVLIDLWPLRASSARGTYMGTIHDREGRLGCVLSQEALLRPHEQPGPPAGKS